MAAVGSSFEREISSAEDALLRMKELVESKASLETLRDFLELACDQLNLSSASKQQRFILSDIYLS